MTVSENPHIRMIHGDSLEAMAGMEDNAYELAKYMIFIDLEWILRVKITTLKQGCGRPELSLNLECRLWHYDVEPAKGNYHPRSSVAVGIFIFRVFMKVRTSDELQVGKAGEYLVCADLILKEFIAYPSEQGLPYDIVLDVGYRIFRVQVKTTASYREVPQRAKTSYAYIFNVKRHGKNNRKRYGKEEVDLFALVALDTLQIGYVTGKDMPATINLRVDQFQGTYYDEKGIKNYKQVSHLRNTTDLSQVAIGKELDLATATVNRMCQPDYEPHITNALYMSDIEREKEWFLDL